MVYDGTNNICARLLLSEDFENHMWRYVSLDVEFTVYPDEAIIDVPGGEPYVDPDWTGDPVNYRYQAALPLDE